MAIDIKAEKRGKIVDTIFYLTIILWSMVWVVWIWTSHVNSFLSIFTIGIVDFLIARIAIWVHGKVIKIKR